MKQTLTEKEISLYKTKFEGKAIPGTFSIQTITSLDVLETSQQLSKEIKPLIFQVGEKETQEGYMTHLVNN